MLDEILCGDCLELLPKMDAGSVDLVLCDLPYGATQNHWDQIIPLDRLWAEYRRVLKPRGAVVLTATNPFASALISSNRKMFRYDLVWEKNKSTGFLNAKKMPLRNHELILVFYRQLPTYNPQKTTGHKPMNSFYTRSAGGNYGKFKSLPGGGRTDRYPKSILPFSVVVNNSSEEERIHSTQKPVAMMEYLIRTYSNPGDVVLDNACGSGTTGVAAINLGRRYILMEKDPEIFAKAQRRLQMHLDRESNE